MLSSPLSLHHPREMRVSKAEISPPTANSFITLRLVGWWVGLIGF